MVDLVIVNPAAAHGLYGPLGEKLIAIEQPQWARIIAGYIRARGWKVKIIDAEALHWSADEVAMACRYENPLLICVAVYGHQPSASTQQMFGAREVLTSLATLGPAAPAILVGGHPSALPERTLREEDVAFVCKGEGPVTIYELLVALDEHPKIMSREMKAAIPGLVWRDHEKSSDAIVVNKSAPLLEINQLDGFAWDLLPMQLYRAHNWQCFGELEKRTPYASIYTSLGCPYSCLTGDTPVNTLYGNIPIKELAEKYGDAGIPVYTYDPETRSTFIADGVKIRRYGINKPLVRVAFDDGTHIDCTPDHEFLQFGWGNGKSGTWQRRTRADELSEGAHVRAVRHEKHPSGRFYVTWGRRDRQHRSRMVMEYLLGRKLARSEHVHHLDHDVSNDHPSNLLYCKSAKDHFALHPEFAERMRLDNPTKNGMDDEWIANLAAANSGKARSAESRLRYRLSKLGRNNPNYRHGDRTGTRSRIAEVNHRVVSVTALDHREDVYCLTVPETGWFFANNVLVKNCSFCCINAPFDSHRYRMRDPVAVVDEIIFLHHRYGVRTFKITDEMFVLNPRHYTAIAEGLINNDMGDKINIWAYARVDTVREDRLNLLRRAGIRWLALGIESASAYVLDGADKRLKPREIAGVVDAIQRAGINVIGNFIFGLPDDDETTMRMTLDLANELDLDFANFYSAMAYPGSPLYEQAVREGWQLPTSWRGYSQHNDDCRPLDTLHVPASKVLAFRDGAFNEFFGRPRYIAHMAQKFGQPTAEHVREMTKYQLKRKLLEAA